MEDKQYELDKKKFNSDVSDKSIEPVDLVKEIKTDFLDYAMSVIVARALPDVRDGLKPVHRRILYGMTEQGFTSAQPHKKSAKIVGDVMGKYHPHGDSSIYEAMVRLAQPFSTRYPLIDGHGNFGSIDGDGAAAMRYTEARLSKIAAEMSRDIYKDTVDFVPNYDGEEKEPAVLPARIPNLLINGANGIAVGMTTNIPPHNLGEVVDATLRYIDNPDVTVEELMADCIPGPDFPTGGEILGKSGVRAVYTTGSGPIVVQSKCEIEESENGKSRILITEIPYAVNKAVLIKNMAQLVKDKVIDGITDIRDESSHEEIRVVVDLRRDVTPVVILNQLMKNTKLRATFSANMLALVDGEPKVLPLKEILRLFVAHQVDVVTRRSKFDYQKCQDRLEIINGLSIAGRSIDEVIKIIRGSKTNEEAQARLMSEIKLTERQAKAVMEMQLQRLTGIQQEKLALEISETQKQIEELNKILNDHAYLMENIKNDLKDVKAKYSDPRRTGFSSDSTTIEDEDLIPVEDIIVTITHNGYVKRVTTDTYHLQNRGGKGIKGITTNENDVVDNILATSTHTDILFFTNLGKVYRLRGHQIPAYSRQGKGLPIVNLLGHLDKGEKVMSMIDAQSYKVEEGLIFVTQQGVVKRVSLAQFANIRQNGKIAITLREGDQLFDVKHTNGSEEIYLASSRGKVVRFNENDVRVMGRNAAGVNGINVDGGIVVGAATSKEGQNILAITEKGYGKMSNREDYRLTKRGGKGVITINVTEKNGGLVAMRAVNGDEDLLITTTKGTIIRLPLAQVKIAGRNTQGVRIIRLDEGQGVASTAVTEHMEEESEEAPSETPLPETETK
ncbi:MAG: DNA gyrase subunit A [Bacilli bacterium]|nr:DNA gyrase subunit A [Bacilli bacterium]